VRAIRRVWRRLLLEWEAGLRGLPLFTQRPSVPLLGVLVATLALLGGGLPVRRPGVGPVGRTVDHLAPARHPPGSLDPVEELLGPVEDTLLP
jgi:hypothetical protein